jgi:hypothetical protein
MKNFIIAGYDKLYKQNSLQHFILENYNKFFENNTCGFMYSFGDSFNPRNTSKINKKVKNYLTYNLSENTMYLDSGGYQLISGKISGEYKNLMLETYYSILNELQKYYSKAFVLDLPPNVNTFKSYDEVRDWNIKSYNTAYEINKQINNKIIFVSHFENLQTYYIFKDLLDEHFLNFTNHSVGGVVVKNKYLFKPISYYVPFQIYLHKCLQNNVRSLKLHFLGTGYNNLPTLIIYHLYASLIRKIYNIDIQVTHDSVPFKTISTSKLLRFFENDTLNIVNFSSKYLHLNYNGIELEKKIIDEINLLLDKNNLSEKRINNLYGSNVNTSFMDLSLSLYDIEVYNKINNYISEQSNNLIELFIDNNVEEFNLLLFNVLKSLNDNKISNENKKTIPSYWKGLEMLCENKIENVDQILTKNNSQVFLTKGVLQF